MLLRRDLRDVVGKRTHEHDIKAEGLFGQGFGDADLLAHIVCRRVARGDDAETAALRHGCGQLPVRDPRHAALKNGVFDPQQVTKFGMDHSFYASMLASM